MNPTLFKPRHTRAVGILCLFVSAGCSSGGSSNTPPTAAVPSVDSVSAPAPDTTIRPAVFVDPAGRTDTVAAVRPSRFASWADSVLAGLSLEEKAGQLLMPWILGDFSPEGSTSRVRILEMVEELGLGGVIVSVGSPTEVAAKLNQLQLDSKLPLLVAADLERAAGFRFRGIVYLPGPIHLGGATEFPSLMAVGATGDEGLARTMGEVTGSEARALGVHVPFAPVLDVNNNPDNPIINIRSFGEDPEDVARLGTAFVRGLQDSGGIATGKHFPGHGDTDTDSHLDLPIIDVSRERMDSVELLPFQAVIDQGIGGIMTAHLSIPSLTEDRNTPATLSPGVLTGLLREDMGFEGLIFTDAMDMYAIDRRHSREEAAVRALEAGADVILMPPDPKAARDGIVSAVEEGRVPLERLDASVMRILQAKESLGLDRDRMVPIEDVAKKVGIEKNQDAAQEVADRSVTLLKNEGDLLPLLGTRSARVLSVTYRGETDLMAGRVLNAGLRERYPRLSTGVLNRNTPGNIHEGLLARARRSDLVVVSLFVTIVSYSGSVALPEEMSGFIQALAEENIPHVVISFGNPYLLREFPDVRSYMLAWSGAGVSQRAAYKALFGDIPIQGTTPTRIPPLFQIGDGIQLPKKENGRDF